MTDKNNSTDIEILTFNSWNDRDGNVELRDAWLSSANYLSAGEQTSLQAYCNLCRRITPFSLSSSTVPPDAREALSCQSCGCNSRIRGALGLLNNSLHPIKFTAPRGWRRFWQKSVTIKPRIYVTEQVTPTFVWMQKNLAAEVLGSEYEPDASRREQLARNLRQLGGHGAVMFQDVTRLDFEDASLDAVVTFDVLEHVPDYIAAIREFSRVLKQGGVCVATFPFNDLPQTLVRARIDAEGRINHIETPEYHGDPISGGVLCYYHFGWEILNCFRDAGFIQAKMVMPFSLRSGLPYGMWTLLAQR